MKIAPGGSPRDAENPRSLFLLHTFEVDKAKEFHLIRKQGYNNPFLVGAAFR